jgi:hypothetical protein
MDWCSGCAGSHADSNSRVPWCLLPACQPASAYYVSPHGAAASTVACMAYGSLADTDTNHVADTSQQPVTITHSDHTSPRTNTQTMHVGGMCCTTAAVVLLGWTTQRQAWGTWALPGVTATISDSVTGTLHALCSTLASHCGRNPPMTVPAICVHAGGARQLLPYCFWRPQRLPRHHRGNPLLPASRLRRCLFL